MKIFIFWKQPGGTGGWNDRYFWSSFSFTTVPKRSFFNVAGILDLSFTAQKMKFSIKNFCSKCDQIRRKLRIWSHLVKKSLMENFIFWALYGPWRVSFEACQDLPAGACRKRLRSTQACSTCAYMKKLSRKLEKDLRWGLFCKSCRIMDHSLLKVKFNTVVCQIGDKRSSQDDIQENLHFKQSRLNYINNQKQKQQKENT